MTHCYKLYIMSKISVVITACNAEKYISETVESVLKQSFADFELIAVHAGSTDKTLSVIRSFADKRIRLIDSSHPDRFESLNEGIKASTGKYIVVLDAGSILHVDMLKLHFSVMEEHPEITICGSTEIVFGKKMPKKMVEPKMTGWVDLPLVELLIDDGIVSPAYMVRRAFINKHNLFYENFSRAEDYKFWIETALLNSGFYMDSQPLVYRRIMDEKISSVHRLDKLKNVSKIKNQLLPVLCEKYSETYPSLTTLNNACIALSDQKLISENDIFYLFHTLFMKNKDSFTSLLTN